MMDCKNAFSESEGDIIKAQEFFRKKGIASADKKATRGTAEGRIGSYIHDSRICFSGSKLQDRICLPR